MNRSQVVIDALANRILDLEDRFIKVDPIDTRILVESQRNENTRRMTESHLRLFRQWLQTKDERRNLEEIEADKLDLYIAQFILGVRKSGYSGKSNDFEHEYEPQTLSAMHSSIHRYLGAHGYLMNIKTDERFRHSRDVLSAKMKQLKSIGKGNKPNASQPFTDNELATFTTLQLLGTSEINCLF